MKASATEIYMQGYILQQTFPMGSDVRDAINNAWGYSQRNGCIATTVIFALAIPSIAVWRNYNADKKKTKD
ncbi:uncharacterized protein AC631_05449 [Debaryomyces fabryi]|uniref:Uncharacterized protein n=1 Tax=Debaryomyces fabryi TaxID=58627 RepID=A0A0V1PRC7_9ASCO|nr:uncharacterized protein AC631_05449 [Debaryomyces fabryi]KRZ98790.1 hypothetical protein AC631_05449 [Debaryomyces fabryi]CUM49430.1 unnamed protein product [Debaryomyces fabryi]